MAVVGRSFLLAVVGLSELSMSKTIAFGGLPSCTRSIQMPGKSASAARLSSVANSSVSNRPIWLVQAAPPSTALPPTIQRMAGSHDRRSASFTSSYPASRPNTD
jgi:hypothetical protein